MTELSNLRLCPKAQIIIVGETEGVSYGAECKDGEWKDVLSRKLTVNMTLSCSPLAAHEDFQSFTAQQGSCISYLPICTQLEHDGSNEYSMPIVGSSTEPVKELIKDGQNGLLIDFFDHHALAIALRN